LDPVTFVAGPVDAAASTIQLSAQTVPADGITPITATIRLRDAFDNPVPNATAVVSTITPGVTITQPPAPSDASGNLVVTITGTTYEPVTLSIAADGVTLEQEETIHFEGPDLVMSQSGPGIGVIGREVTYTLTIENSGLLTAADAAITNNLPPYMSYVRQTSSFTPTLNNGDPTWQIGDLAVGASAQITLVARLNAGASLDSQLTNEATATAATPEEDTANNQATTTLTVGPGFVYDVTVTPVDQTMAIGGAATYEVAVQNNGNLADEFTLTLNDLNPAWYTVSPSSLSLAAGEIGYTTLTVQTDVCTNAGIHPFFVLSSSAGQGNTTTTPASLTLIPETIISEVLPQDNTSIGATSSLFTWQTAVTATTSIFIREVGSPTFTEHTGAPGLLHQVEVTGLNRNTDYEWYVRSDSACGSEESLVRTLSVLNGVVFAERSYNFTVDRDYNQFRSIRVHNQDVISHTVVITIENPYPELIVGFVGDGSIDNAIVLQPGQTHDVELGIHTQDVTIDDLDLIARLVADDGGNQLIQDAVPVNLNIHTFVFDLIIEEIDSDPTTLVKTYRVTNNGDTVTDLAITANIPGSDSVYLSPGMSHGRLPAGSTFEFEAIPALGPDFQNLSGAIVAAAAGQSVETGIDISLPAGYSIYLGEANNMSMEAGTRDWYCTNRPVINNRIVLPNGFRREDVVSSQFQFMATSRTDVRPHDVTLFVNGNQIGKLENTIPHGLYTFPLDPDFLKESIDSPSVNYVTLQTEHMNGGHYVVANEMLISICLSSYREWVPAASQTEADQIVSSRSFLIPPPGVLDVTILAPTEGQTVPAGIPVTVTARIDDDLGRPWSYAVTMQASNGNGGIILFDDGVHGDGAAKDGVYGNRWLPLNPGETVLTIDGASCSTVGSQQVIVQVIDAAINVAVAHQIPVTGTTLLPNSVQPAADVISTSVTTVDISWSHVFTPGLTAQQDQFDLALPDMKPGEVRQVAEGTTVSYVGGGNSGQVTLPPLYVAAQHLIAISPSSQTVSQGGQSSYQVALHNPGASGTWILSVAGLPLGWAELDSSVSLAAGSSITLPLTINVPYDAALGDYPFAVVVETDTGGQDQAGATLIVMPLDFETAVSPPQLTVDTGATAAYTVTVTNLAAVERTFALTVTGLDDNEIDLPDTVTVGANNSIAVPLQITAYAGYGPHPFQVWATAVDNNNQQSDNAVVSIRGDRRVTAELSPATAVGGPGIPVAYTLEVTNGGTLSDTYDLSVALPNGWSYRLYTDSDDVDSISLTPYVFNSMTLLLEVIPVIGAAPGDYPITATVQSVQNPVVRAEAGGELTLIPYGVQVDIQPETSSMNPTDTSSWSVIVTNVGEEPDTYDLVAGGIVAESAQFSTNPVSLSPGESQTVQLTAGGMDYVLPQTYPLSVMATSLYDDHIQNADTASVTFTGYEGVDVALLPVSQTLTDTVETTFMMVITNTGNIATAYDLTLIAPGLQYHLETDQVYIPAKMVVQIRVSLLADAAGTYQITGQTTSTTGSVSDQSNATLIVAQDALNEPPTAMNDIAITQANTAITIDVLTNDNDPDGDPLTILGVSPPQNGTAVINSDNSITYTPDGDAMGTDSFVYTIGDDHDHIAVATVAVAVNHDPEAVDDTTTTNEDMAVTISVLDNDSDTDGDTLTVISTTLPLSGTAVINPDNTVTYTPTLNIHGVDNFSYTIDDGRDGFNTAVVTVTIQPVNDAPIALDDNAVTDEDTAVLIDLLTNDNDIDGDSLTISSITQPGNGVVEISAGSVITYTPDADYNSGDSADGGDSFSYVVGDGQGASATAVVTVTVNPINDAPVAVDDLVDVNEDTAVTVDILANDSDVDGDSLILISITQPTQGVAVINPDHTVTYTPTLNYHGADSFSYLIDDGHNVTSEAWVQLTVLPVNDAPTTMPDDAVTEEDVAATIFVLTNDIDVDGDVLTVTAVTTPTYGTTFINPDNSILYTPNSNFNGEDNFTYTASDAEGSMDTTVVTITVTPVNDAPLAVADEILTAEETAVTIIPLANDSDVDGDVLTVTAITTPTHGVAFLNVDNSVAYTPTLNYAGEDAFVYTIMDSAGAAATATITVTVSNENDNPVAANDESVTDEDMAVTIGVLANDTDVDGDTLTITSVTTPTNGLAAINPDNSITYTPNGNYNGDDSFSYTISDGNGGSATAIVSLTVMPVNDAPTAMDDSAMTNEDTAVAIPVLDNDSDVDGDTLTVTVTITPTMGTVIVHPDNSVTYTPHANEHGEDSFTYAIDDGAGGIDTAVVTLSSIPVNDTPNVVDDIGSLDEDTAVTIDALANDSDVDGDTLTIVAISQPEHGTAVINSDYTLTYTPTADYDGGDSFTYTVDDGHGATATALVLLAVDPVNDAPIANNDVATTPEDTTVTVAVLANDSDVDGDALSVITLTQPLNGIASINPDNAIVYTPTLNFNDVDTLVYTIDDGHDGLDTATLHITVTPVNDPPTAADDLVTTEEDTPIVIDVLGNDVDIDGDSLTVITVTQAISGAVVNNGVDLTYTPAVGFSGTDSFDYTLSDGHGETAMAVVTVTVTAVNTNPIAADDSATTDEQTPIQIDILANDTDPDGDSLTVTAVTPPMLGVATLNIDNTLTYTPTGGAGVDSFTYTVSDGEGGSDTAVVTVTVTPSLATLFLLIDEDSFDTDAPAIEELAAALGMDPSVMINDDIADVGVRDPLQIPIDSILGAGYPGGTNAPLETGEVGDEGWFRLTQIPSSWDAAGPTDDGLRNLVLAGPGLGSGNDPEALLDKIPGVTPLQTTGLQSLPGQRVCALVYDSDISMNYDPLEGSLKGANLGLIAFDILAVGQPNGDELPDVTIRILDTDDICAGLLTINPGPAVNYPPETEGDDAVTDVGTAVAIPVLTNDVDMDGDDLMVTAVGQPALGEVVINADGSLIYTPNGDVGVDNFSCTISDGQDSSMGVVTVEVTAVGASCSLYPIALHSDTLLGAQPGDTLSDIFNGTQPGSFGWLTWTGKNKTRILAASLTPPGNSDTYINPDDPDDHLVSIGDWVAGKPGVSNSKKVRNALNALMGTEIVVPVWDATTGNGNNTRYQVSNFATVRILDYHLPGQDRITVEFLGMASCNND
ncbi:MAG: tandem-95 repeat protein, partial [Chloroflexi bacterium]|nr:tandem-95 repeat protein [Chloroflexota bacterium]